MPKPRPPKVRPLGKELANAARELTRTKGRPPSVYRPELAIEICERVAEGETLRQICQSDGMPTATTFRRWVVAEEPLREAWHAARELKADTLFDEALDMARAVAEEPGTTQRLRGYDLAMQQLRWSAGKLNPAKYSERSQLSFIVPIQINTSLDLGQPGAVTEQGSVYEVKAEIKEEPAAGVDDKLVAPDRRSDRRDAPRRGHDGRKK
jgi:hypothetical protein